MDLVNKIKNTVQSTVGGLIGIPLSKDFDINKHHASAGPGYIWKIYSAVKRSTKEEVSVFVLEKKLLEKYSRREREFLLDIFKKGVTQLTRLRHPKLLTVQHPLEESREYFAFATEPVFASLGNVLGCHDNLPSPVPTEVKDYELYDVEIKYGLQQVIEALAFLHNDVHLIHGNIIPANVIINSNGSWKLSGLDFCIPSSTKQHDSGQAVYNCKEWDPSLPDIGQPVLNYLAPEYIRTVSCDTASDMYSLGMLIYTLFNHGKPLFDCNANLKTYQRNCQQLSSLNLTLLNCLPEVLRDYVKMLFSITPTIRPDAHQLTKISFFDDVGAKTLEHLDSLFQLDNLQKSQFFKGLPQIISKLPKRVVLQRVLPCLFKEFYNSEMIPFVLPNVLLIAESCTQKEYTTIIFPHLKPIFKLQEPIQILLIFLHKMDLLLSKTPSDDIKHHVLPMVYKALETPSPQIQELCLSIIPTFASMIEYSSMKHSIIPRIKTLCLRTDLLSVRVNCLICIGKLLEYMDKWYVLDEILPLLQEIPSREPAVLMAMLGIYKTSLDHKKLGITKEILATKVLPFLFPLCIDNNLNLNQFNAFMSVIKSMIGQVENDQRSKLQQLSTMQKEQRSTIEFTAESNGKPKQEDFFDQLQQTGHKTQETDSMMDKMFKSFGLGSFIQTKSDKLNAASKGETAQPVKSQTAAPSQSSLTLEDKQRLQKEQEQQQRFKKQQQLKPTETVKTTKSQPKDLTSSLATSTMSTKASTRSSNYDTGTGWTATSSMGAPRSTMGMTNTMGSPGPVGAPGTMGMTGNMGMSMGNNRNMAMTGPTSASSYGMTGYNTGIGASYSVGNTGYGMGASGNPYGTSSMNPSFGMSSMSQTPQSTMYNQNMQQTKQKVDLSAFDDLLGPSQSQKNKVSMNAMSSAQAQQPSTQSNKPITASDDLSDLLG